LRPRQLGKHLGGIRGAAEGEAAQLVTVAPFTGQLHKHVSRIVAADLGQATELVEISSLARQLHEPSDGVAVTVLRQQPQFAEIGIRQGQDLHCRDRVMEGTPRVVAVSHGSSSGRVPGRRPASAAETAGR